MPRVPARSLGTRVVALIDHHVHAERQNRSRSSLTIMISTKCHSNAGRAEAGVCDATRKMSERCLSSRLPSSCPYSITTPSQFHRLCHLFRSRNVTSSDPATSNRHPLTPHRRPRRVATSTDRRQTTSVSRPSWRAVRDLKLSGGISPQDRTNKRWQSSQYIGDIFPVQTRHVQSRWSRPCAGIHDPCPLHARKYSA